MSGIPFSEKSILLAPMAGITDSGFRRVCRKYGADGTVSEMVSSKGIFYGDGKSKALMRCRDDEQPFIIQLFGSDPRCMEYAAGYISDNLSPVAIDINMGCPAPKIYQNGDGCALMKTPEKARDVIAAVAGASRFPVSVKFRSGVDSEHINAVEFAKMCQSAGADFITVHGRTREQYYKGVSDCDAIRKVVLSVSIPVIANGDVCDGESAEKILNETGAHSLMVGRAAIGNPLIFALIKSRLFNAKFELPRLMDVALEHLDSVIEDKGEAVAVLEFRKHMLSYLKGVKNAAELKRMSCAVSTREDCARILNIAE